MPQLQQPQQFPDRNRRERIQLSSRELEERRIGLMRIAEAGGTETDFAKYLDMMDGKNTNYEVMPPPSQPSANANDMDMSGFLGDVRGLTMRATQGITFGFGDEAIGGIVGLLTGGFGNIDEGIARYRREMDDWSKDHKKLGLATEIVAGVLSGSTWMKAGKQVMSRLGAATAGKVGTAVARPVTNLTGLGPQATQATMQAGSRVSVPLGQRITQSAKIGAGYGAAAGAGHTEGGLSDRTKGALLGGILGAGLSGVLVPAGRLVGNVTRPGARAATRGMSALQQRFPSIGTPEMTAREQLRRAIAQDGLTMDMMRQRMLEFQKTGTPFSVIDIAGPTVLKLAQESLQNVNPAKLKLIETLLTRQSDQGARIVGRVFQQVFKADKMGFTNAFEAEEWLNGQRYDLSQPFYQASFQETVPVSNRMWQLLQNPRFKAAWNKGIEVARDETTVGRYTGPEITALPIVSSKQLGVDLAQKLSAKSKPESLPIAGFDYMKRTLQQWIKSAKDGRITDPTKTLEARHATALEAALEEVLQEVDNHSLNYQAARQIWAGFSKNADAVKLGRENFWRKSVADIARDLRDMHPGQRDYYRIGAYQSIYDRVTGVEDEFADIAGKFFGGKMWQTNNKAADRIRALFPDAPEAAEELMRMVSAEARIYHTGVVTGIRNFKPSKVAAQLGEHETIGLPTVRARAGMTVIGGLREAVIKSNKGWTQDVSDELALLFSKGLENPGELEILLGVLDATGKTLTRRTTSATNISSGLGYAGGLAGSRIF